MDGFIFGATFHSVSPLLTSSTPPPPFFSTVRSRVHCTSYCRRYDFVDLSSGWFTGHRAPPRQHAYVPSRGLMHSIALFGAQPHSMQFSTAAPRSPFGSFSPVQFVARSSVRMKCRLPPQRPFAPMRTIPNPFWKRFGMPRISAPAPKKRLSSHGARGLTFVVVPMSQWWLYTSLSGVVAPSCFTIWKSARMMV